MPILMVDKSYGSVDRTKRCGRFVLHSAIAIVLVNEQQRQQLKLAQANRDRFNREVESGQEQLSQPANPFTVSGVPEPEEWMLIGIVAIALLFLAYRRQSTVN
ncbi:MAG TPA: hypothetical protein V6D09_18870 [Leptolyngbyaceae cyanobacterium]